MLFDFSHTFLVVAFVLMWGMIAQFAFIKHPKTQTQIVPHSDPPDGQ